MKKQNTKKLAVKLFLTVFIINMFCIFNFTAVNLAATYPDLNLTSEYDKKSELITLKWTPVDADPMYSKYEYWIYRSYNNGLTFGKIITLIGKECDSFTYTKQDSVDASKLAFKVEEYCREVNTPGGYRACTDRIASGELNVVALSAPTVLTESIEINDPETRPAIVLEWETPISLNNRVSKIFCKTSFGWVREIGQVSGACSRSFTFYFNIFDMGFFYGWGLNYKQFFVENASLQFQIQEWDLGYPGYPPPPPETAIKSLYSSEVMIKITHEDLDEDGLTNIFELNKIGVNPLRYDTDNDELNDYDELYIYKTEPNNPDTDGDGGSDGNEVNYFRTNPDDIENWDGGMVNVNIVFRDACPHLLPGNPKSEDDGSYNLHRRLYAHIIDQISLKNGYYIRKLERLDDIKVLVIDNGLWHGRICEDIIRGGEGNTYHPRLETYLYICYYFGNSWDGGFQYAIDNAYDIISLSYYLPYSDGGGGMPAVSTLVDDYNIVLSCGIGNSNNYKDGIGFAEEEEGKFFGVSYHHKSITIGSLEQANREPYTSGYKRWKVSETEGSNYGKGEYSGNPTGIDFCTYENIIKPYTSWSGPNVARTIYQMLLANPNLTPEDIRQILRNKCTKIAGYNYNYSPPEGWAEGWNNKVGYGMVDRNSAIAKAKAYLDEL